MCLTMGPVASLLFFVPLWGPQVTLKGIKGQGSSRPVSYTLADGMILTAMMAIATSLASSIRSEMPEDWFLFFVFIANFLTFLLWFKCQKFMSTNGIWCSRQRALMQLFVYPSSVLAIAYLSISLLMFFSGVIEAIEGYASIIYLIAVSSTIAISVFWIRITRTVYRKIVAGESNGQEGEFKRT